MNATGCDLTLSGRDSLPPWAVDRYRLWSLLEMLQFCATQFGASMSTLAKIGGSLRNVSDLRPSEREEIANELGEVIKLFNQMALSTVLRDQVRRLQERVPDASYGPDKIHLLLSELHNNLLVELSDSLFMEIPANRRHFYEDSQPFGEQVAEVFPEASLDIIAASRCLALDEWTASVFHLMTVLEIGLRTLTKRLGIKMTKRGLNVDYAQWYDLISAVQSEIKKRGNPPNKLTSAQRKRLDWLNEMVAHFSNCNVAWRTHVSHGRGKYDQREAEEIWMHVRSFMQLLARGPS